MTFPSVTVCNVNRVHCGNLKNVLRQAFCAYEEIIYEYPLIYDDFDINAIDCSTVNTKLVENIQHPEVFIWALADLYWLTNCYVPDGYVQDAYDIIADIQVVLKSL